jgi:hypothetical protein
MRGRLRPAPPDTDVVMAVVTIVLTVLRASVILFALLDAPPGCSEPASGLPGDGPRATDRTRQPPDHA